MWGEGVGCGGGEEVRGWKGVWVGIRGVVGFLMGLWCVYSTLWLWVRTGMLRPKFIYRYVLGFTRER